jgi:hypothetical protein
MDNTILDQEDNAFFPSDTERPAGQWMEGYWLKIAHWSKFLSIFMGVAVVLSILSNILSSRYIFIQEGSAYDSLLLFVTYWIARSPYVLLTGISSYKIFHFSQNLHYALKDKDQIKLDAAFASLNTILLFWIIIVAINLLTAFFEIYTLFTLS